MSDFPCHIFMRVVNHPCATFYTSKSRKMDTTNTFQFLAFYAQNVIILLKFCLFKTYSA